MVHIPADIRHDDALFDVDLDTSLSYSSHLSKSSHVTNAPSPSLTSQFINWICSLLTQLGNFLKSKLSTPSDNDDKNEFGLNNCFEIGELSDDD